MLETELIASIKNSHSIAILPHVNMDGDALSSSLALYLALKKMGKEAVIIAEEEPQEIFKFLPSIGEISLFNENSEGLENRIFDMVVVLDSSDFERLKSRGQIFKNAKTTGNIDHHPTNTNFAQFNYVVTTAAATGEIVYQIIKTIGIDIDKDIATCIYSAITSDTGGFKFANTTALTHQIASELINNGVNSAWVCTNLFENNSIERIKITGEVINRMEFYQNGKISLICLPKSVIEQYNVSEEDIGGFSNMGRTIRGVEVAVFIRERESGNLKVSMRSKDKVDLTHIATKYGGGGHKRAAGFEYNGTLLECKEILLKELLEIV